MLETSRALPRAGHAARAPDPVRANMEIPPTIFNFFQVFQEGCTMPDNLTDPTAALSCLESQSSLLTKLDADTRRRLDRAIIDRSPPTYRGLYETFELADMDVSFTAFYYYARRLRLRASLLELARLEAPDDANLDKQILPLLAQRLLETLLEEGISSRTILRLAHAYSKINYVDLSRRRLDDAGRENRRHIKDLCQLMETYAAHLEPQTASETQPPEPEP
jgi:hypothetical protein